MFKTVALIVQITLAVTFSASAVGQNDQQNVQIPQLSDQQVSDVTECIALTSLIATVASERGKRQIARAALTDAKALAFIALTQRSEQQVRTLVNAHAEQLNQRFNDRHSAKQIIGSTFRKCQALVGELRSKFTKNQ